MSRKPMSHLGVLAVAASVFSALPSDCGRSAARDPCGVATRGNGK